MEMLNNEVRNIFSPAKGCGEHELIVSSIIQTQYLHNFQWGSDPNLKILPSKKSILGNGLCKGGLPEKD